MTEMEEGRLLRECRWLCIQTEQCVSRRLSPMDITAVQAHILLFLLHQGEQGTLLTDIHRSFGYSMPTLSCMVKRLREKGYIRAEHCRGDDRRRLLFATETARLLQPELERSIGAVHRRLYDGFSPEELDTLDRLQQKLLRNLSPLMKETQKEESKS